MRVHVKVLPPPQQCRFGAQSPAGSRRGGDSAPVLFWDRAYTAAGRPASTIAIDIADHGLRWLSRAALATLAEPQ